MEELVIKGSRCDTAKHILLRTIRLGQYEEARSLVLRYRARGKFYWSESVTLIRLLEDKIRDEDSGS